MPTDPRLKEAKKINTPSDAWELLKGIIIENFTKGNRELQEKQAKITGGKPVEQLSNKEILALNKNFTESLGNFVLAGGPARVEPDPRKTSLVDKIVDYLTRVAPKMNLQVGRTAEKEFSKNMDNLYRLSRENPEYPEAIDKWLGGPSQNFRDAIIQRTLNPEDYSNPNILRMARRLEELLLASRNGIPTKGTLYRHSTGEEIPHFPNINIGDTFDNPFLSFSSNPKYRNFPPKLILEPGASALRLGGVSGAFPREQEYIVGGNFKIQDILKNSHGNPLVRIKQVQ